MKGGTDASRWSVKKLSNWLTVKFKIDNVVEMLGHVQLVCVRKGSSWSMRRTGMHLRIRADGLVLVNRFCQLGHMLVFCSVDSSGGMYEGVEKG